MPSSFQFLDGTIKMSWSWDVETNKVSFNSLMVQLKYIGCLRFTHRVFSFNSLMVQLKSDRTNNNATANTSFNSLMVQLKLVLGNPHYNISLVSIP